MKLYEITDELTTAINKYVESENEAEMEELAKVIGDLNMSFQEKAVAVAHYCINQESDVEAIKAEIERLKALKTARENGAERMKQYLKAQMEASAIDKIESPTLRLSIRKNPVSVVVDDEALVPQEYKRIKTIVEVDKRAIGEAFKNGTGVIGTHTEQKTRLDIR